MDREVITINRDAEAVNPSPRETHWRQLYREALFELDPSKISNQIVKAEEAIVERTKALFEKDGDSYGEEKLALDDATYFLHALRSTLEFKTSSRYLGDDQIEAA